MNIFFFNKDISNVITAIITDYNNYNQMCLNINEKSQFNSTTHQLCCDHKKSYMQL